MGWKTKKVKMIVQILLVLFYNSNAFGQYQDTKHDTHFHRNHIAIFTGATTELEREKGTDFTIGVDYVRRFSKSGLLGIGVFGEVNFDKHTELVFGLPLYFYPTNNFWLRAGPGLDIHKKEEKSHSNETEVGYVIRTGLGYDFEISGFTIGPNLSIDFFREKTSLVWGINIGRGF